MLHSTSNFVRDQFASLQNDESSNQNIIHWKPGTWIRRPVTKLIRHPGHHAIAITNNYIIEAYYDDGDHGQKCKDNVEVGEHVYKGIVEMHRLSETNKVKDKWIVVQEPKGFKHGLGIVENAVCDIGHTFEYSIFGINCETFVYKWYNISENIGNPTQSSIAKFVSVAYPASGVPFGMAMFHGAHAQV